MVWNTPGSGPDRNRQGARQAGSQRQSNGGWRSMIQPHFSGEGLIRRWIIIVAVLIVAASSIHVIQEQQQGVVLRFGRLSALLPPGIAVTWPWPIESVTKINATALKTYRAELSLLTADESSVLLTVNVQYQIGDPRQYLFASRNADQILEQIVHSVVREQVGHSPWSRLFQQPSVLAASAKENLQAALKSYQTGLVVSDLTFANLRPPDALKAAFDAVDDASGARARAMSEANAYAADVIPQARGRAESIRVRAQADKLATISQAQGQAERFSLVAKTDKDDPVLTRQRLWYETMEQVLKQNHKIINSDGRNSVSITYQINPIQLSAATPPVSQPALVQALPRSSEALAEPSVPIKASPEPLRNPERQPRASGR